MWWIWNSVYRDGAKCKDVDECQDISKYNETCGYGIYSWITKKGDQNHDFIRLLLSQTS